ncbi:MAG TPA: DUF1501 domain-containing protein [Pirellulales bacterium]|nr:DUF1501 domain-containing protein [Pirellulales bacterium]
MSHRVPRFATEKGPPRPAPSRRRFLQSTLVAGGMGLAWSDILRLRAQAAEAGKPATDTAVIQIWLGGGPSQFETFDPKPLAPIEIRGPYDAIQSKLPGALVCEKLPLTAGVLDKTAIIRSFTHPFDDHFGVTRWCLAGRKEPDNSAAYPSLGSIASRFRGPRQAGMPGYALLTEEPANHYHLFSALGPGYLGVAHAPFTVLQGPYQPEFQRGRLRDVTQSLELANDMSLDRFNDRKTLLSDLDRLTRRLDSNRAGDIADPFTRVALEMISGAKARRAFDLGEESAATHERYGTHRWGQMALLARRLVEAGVTFVTLNTAPDCLRWDWHVSVYKEDRVESDPAGPIVGMEPNGPPLDRALSALIADLSERDSCQKVLLIVWGEFGRSPRVNPSGGREHWPPLGSVLLAGGGLKMGQIIGESDARGAIPTQRPISPSDVLATLYRHLDIDPNLQTVDHQGRPISLLPDGKPIDELF